MPRIVDFHPSVLIAYSEKNGKLITSVYDGGYPQEPFRFSANLIGGNPNKNDTSPLSVLEREIEEEVNPWASLTEDVIDRKDWANREDILFIKTALLTNVEEYADFYFHGLSFKKGKVTEYDAIFSAFFVNISEDVIDCLEKNLRECKKIVTEGLIGTFKLDILEKRGEYGTAHGTASILNHRFDAHIPHPEGVRAEILKTPVRGSFKDYLSDSELCYKPTWLRE